MPEHFRATGPGWQARIDEVLKRHATMARRIGREVAEAQGGQARVAEEREAFRGEDQEQDQRRHAELASASRVEPL